MPKKTMDLSESRQMEIDQFKTEKGAILHTLRQMYVKGGKSYAVKTKSGGYSSVCMDVNSWRKTIALLQNYFDLAGASEADLAKMAGGGKEGACKSCASMGENLYCSECVAAMLATERTKGFDEGRAAARQEEEEAERTEPVTVVSETEDDF